MCEALKTAGLQSWKKNIACLYLKPHLWLSFGNLKKKKKKTWLVAYISSILCCSFYSFSFFYFSTEFALTSFLFTMSFCLLIFLHCLSIPCFIPFPFSAPLLFLTIRLLEDQDCYYTSENYLYFILENFSSQTPC